MSKVALINHVALVLDESLSMLMLRNKTVQVADQIVKFLADESEKMNQETRATVYTFNNKTSCVYFDKDVLRLPSIANDYHPRNNTALVDATMQAVSDLKQTATMYGDHSFIVYVITDGEENQSSTTNKQNIASTLSNLPENWTMAVLVPNTTGQRYAQNFGFPAGNIAIWDATSAAGVEAIGQKIQAATSSYMTNRTVGMRGTKSLFENVKVEKLVKPTTDKYLFLDVDIDEEIKPFVTRKLGFYQIGSTFYPLVKTEKVQASKKLAILDKATGEVYTGAEARQMVGLPDAEVRISPENHPKFQLFVQSKSVTRKLAKGDKVLVLNA